MNAERNENREKEISEIAKTIYIESQKKGLENEPERDWKQAEAIYDNKLKYYFWWIPFQFFRRNNYKIFSLVVAFFILLIVWGVEKSRNSEELNTRPYLSVDIIKPMQIVDEDKQNTYYGNYIILRNSGKTPASNVSTLYYMTTNIDNEKVDSTKWFNEKISGLGMLRFIAPETIQKEPAFRSLSPSAEYYYFETIATYKGLRSKKQYWTSIKKVFHINKETGNFNAVYICGEWDRNRNVAPPAISTEKEITALLEKTKSKDELLVQSEPTK